MSVINLIKADLKEAARLADNCCPTSVDVSDVKASVRKCIKALDLIAAVLEEMDKAWPEIEIDVRSPEVPREVVSGYEVEIGEVRG